MQAPVIWFKSVTFQTFIQATIHLGKFRPALTRWGVCLTESIYVTSQDLFWVHLHSILGCESKCLQPSKLRCSNRSTKYLKKSLARCASASPCVREEYMILLSHSFPSLSWRHFQAVPVSTHKIRCGPLMADPLEVFITSVMVLPLCNVIHFKQ